MSKNITKKQLERAINSQVVKELVAQYIVARVKAEVIRSEVDKIERAVLQEVALFDDAFPGHSTGERITEPKHTYLSRDGAGFSRYCQICSDRERAAGIKSADLPDEYCPALVAETERSEIENKLIEASGKPLGVTNDKLLCSSDGKGLEHRREWIDLVVGAALALEREGR